MENGKLSRQMENGKRHHKTKPRLYSLVVLPEFSHQKKEENVF